MSYGQYIHNIPTASAAAPFSGSIFLGFDNNGNLFSKDSGSNVNFF